MRLPTSRHPRVNTGVAMSLLSASFVVAAVNSDGFHATSVQLHDASVWTYQSDDQYVAKINTQTVEAEIGIAAEGTQGILQDGAVAYAVADGHLYLYDPVEGISQASEPLPPQLSVAVGGGVGVLLDQASGNVWVAPARSLAGWKADLPVATKVGQNSVATVTDSGRVLVVDPSTDEYVSITLDEQGQLSVGEAVRFAADIPDDPTSVLTSVGDRPALLTVDGLFLPDAAVDRTQLGEEPAIQWPSAGGDRVVVASSAGLLGIGFDGSVTSLVGLDATGAARPAVVDGCVNGAWSSPEGAFVQLCDGSEPTTQPIPGYTGGSLVFRVNHSAVVLAGRGKEQWVVRDGTLRPITNWDQVNPNNQQQDTEPPLLEETEDQTERTCDDDVPQAPSPRDTTRTFGAKPLNTIIIDVVGLYDDVNCDPLAVKNVTSSADANGAAPSAVAVNFGQSIQFRAPEAAGSYTIKFVVSDGMPAHDTPGQVTVEVSADSSSKPRLKNPNHTPTTAVQVNKTITYNVLADWTDDDGDLLTLVGVSLPPNGGSRVFGADGMLTYTASTTTGEKELTVEVQDEAGNRETGILRVVVQPAGTPIPPVARDDYATARVGAEVIVYPLRNDTDANGDLANAVPHRDVLSRYPGLRMDGPDSQQAVTLSASEAGTYIIPYDAVDAQGQSSRAAIRLDVVAAEEGNHPPVAVSDAVVVRTGRTANVDVLVNDFDADGDVLAVVEARLADSNVPARVVVIERRYVRVEVTGVPAQPTFVVEYTISDGAAQPSLGELKVTVPSGQENQAPITQPDSALVRAGQVVSIDVLANDRDPDGDQLFIRPDSVRLAQADAEGVAWLDGTTVRFRAPADAPSAPVIIQYAVEDDPDMRGLQPVSSTISVRVVPVDEKNNPPQPKPSEMRVFTNSSATLSVPLTGVDPDGDRVILEGIEILPTLGTAEVVGDTIVYHAGATAGSDSFQYRVRDTGLGSEDGRPLTALATVRVVVVDGLPHSPVPLNDRLVTRPGRAVSINVLANDTDPDGDAIQLHGARWADGGAGVSMNGDRVDVQIPSAEGTYIVVYEINDSRSPVPQTALISIEVREDAPLLPPVARDDPDGDRSPIGPVEVFTAADGTTVKTVEVKVTGNDDDPDGSPSALVAGLVPGQEHDGAALAPLATDSVRVVLANDVQWLVYESVDPDGNAARAVVAVPGLRNRQPACPALPVGKVSIPFQQGSEPLNVKISDALFPDPDGDTVQLVGLAPKVAVGSQGSVITVHDGDFSQFWFAPDNAETKQQVVLEVLVEDRKGEADTNKVTCAVKIDIVRENEPPTTDGGSFTVENATSRVESLGNLRDELGIVVDPDAGDTLSFVQLGETTQNGVTLTIDSAGNVSYSASGADIGMTLQFPFTVTDNQPTTPAPVEGVLRVEIVRSTEPPALIQNHTFEDVEQGKPFEVNLLEGSFNPFPDTPLELSVDGQPSQGAGAVQWAAGSSTMTFTPGAEFFGVAIVGYSALDKADRVVSATVTFTVIGRPGPPGQPDVTDVASHRATVTWAPADPKGTPVTNYKVTWPGGEADAGTATTITLTNLANGTPLQFTVVATNKVGDSDPSAQSGAVTPDQVPNTPSAPVIQDFGDRLLLVTWAAPEVDGTPISEFRVMSSTGEVKVFGPNELQVWWDGLDNGTPYSFTVIAKNGAGDSERSASSTPLSPAREPDAPTNVVAADAGDGVVQQLTVSWQRPADNGRPISGYVVYVKPAGGAETPLDFSSDPATSQTIPVGDGDYTFRVVAVNVVGPSATSASSGATRSIKTPAAPAPLSAASDQDRLTTLTFTNLSGDGPTGGCAVTYEYSLGGAWTALAANKQIGSLTNGTAYNVQVRAKNCKYTGPPSPSASFKPSGPPIASGISLSGSANGLTINWSWNASAALNGANSYTFTLDGSPVGQSGSQAKPYASYSTNYSATLRVTDNLGRSAERTVSVSTGPPPLGDVSIGYGSASTYPCYHGEGPLTGDTTGCYNLSVTLTGWTGTQTVRVFYTTNSGSWQEIGSFQAGNGTSSWASFSSAGRRIVVVVGGTIAGQCQDCGAPSPSTGKASNVIVWTTY